MNTLNPWPQTSLILQETQNALSLRGIKLSKADILDLAQTFQYICKKRHWVETDNKKIEQILSPFLTSPYISTINYLDIFKNIIISYYEVRSRFHRFIEDSTIIDAMKIVYRRCGGTLDVYYIESVLHQVHRMEETK